MTVSDIEGEALVILLMGSETTDLLSEMFIEKDEAVLRDLGDGDVKAGVSRVMEGLEERGLVESRRGEWLLTPAGTELGQSVVAARS
jgi:hypothetical protein